MNLIARSHPPILPLILYIVAAIFCCIPANCLGIENQELVILSPPDKEDELTALRTAIRSQLVDFTISADVYVLDESVKLTALSIDIAQSYLKKSNQNAVLWISGNNFHLYIHDGEDSHFFSRPLPNSSDSWELQCDAIASVVRSMIASWRGDDSTLHASSDTAHPSERDETQKNEKEASTPSSSPRNTTFIQAGVGLAYAPFIMSSHNPWVSGIGASLSLRIGEYLQVGLAPGLAFAMEKNYRLFRVPLRLEVGAWIEKSKFNVGIEISFITDITHISHSTQNRLSKADVVYIGFGTTGMIAYKWHPRLWGVCKAGIDIYSSSNTYWEQSNIVFSYEPIQARLSFGIIFWL